MNLIMKNVRYNVRRYAKVMASNCPEDELHNTGTVSEYYSTLEAISQLTDDDMECISFKDSFMLWIAFVPVTVFGTFMIGIANIITHK